jgi:hypothetical protein
MNNEEYVRMLENKIKEAQYQIDLLNQKIETYREVKIIVETGKVR